MSRAADSKLTEDKYLVTYEVGPGDQGLRLDQFLKERYRKRSREVLKKAIDEGAVTVKRTQSAHLTIGKLKASSQLIAGDEVLVLSERKAEPEVSFDYKVIFEDEGLFVIEKPANLPVHPAGRYFFNTLLTHLKTQGHKNPLKMEREYFLVHRIDKETSGILLLAKNKEFCADLVKQFADRKTEKKYLAVVRGVPKEDSFTVDEPLERDPHSRVTLKMAVVPESDGGQPSLTRFEVRRRAGNYTVLECFPKTGRQHQIRIHACHAGHPLVGDKLYGIDEELALKFYERERLTAEDEAKLILPRHALHSAGLAFTHPVTKKRMEFTSPLPKDLEDFLVRAEKGLV